LIESTKEFWTNAYQKNVGKLIAICYRYTRNYQLSEDLAHDAFLKAIDKSASFRGEGEFDAWLRRIVVNHVLQYLRDQKKNPYLEDLILDHEDTVSTEENMHLIEFMGFTTEELLEIIDQLPEHHRLVFNLYVLEKFTHAQIGEELGISEGTSKSHLARARKKLRQLLVLKVEQPGKEEDDKRGFLPAFIGDDTKLDQMFEESFSQFSIPPKHPLSMGMISLPGQQGFGWISFIKSHPIILGASVILPIFLISLLILRQSEKPKENKVNDQGSSFLPNGNYLGNDTYPGRSSHFQSATNVQDSVIADRNLNFKKMKPLDSLALMLVLASSNLNTSSMQDSVRNQIVGPSLVLPLSDSAGSKSELPASIVQVVSRKETGTFRASKIYWAKDNQEVYFEGEVSVNFKKQHFRGRGSFNFLGKVRLLIVDGLEADLGKTVKLSNDEYQLEELDSKEAISKYGERGRYGAIEISRSN
jgi:RNA polymerase sigma factor (sigma-70 family)